MTRASAAAVRNTKNAADGKKDIDNVPPNCRAAILVDDISFTR